MSDVVLGGLPFLPRLVYRAGDGDSSIVTKDYFIVFFLKLDIPCCAACFALHSTFFVFKNLFGIVDIMFFG